MTAIEKIALPGSIVSLGAFAHGLDSRNMPMTILAVLCLMGCVGMFIHVQELEKFFIKHMYSIRFVGAFITLGIGLFVLIMGIAIQNLWLNGAAIMICIILMYTTYRLLQKSSTAN